MKLIVDESGFNVLLGCIDSLALALANHEHVWTDGERAIYEEAAKVLGVHTEEQMAKRAGWTAAWYRCKGCGHRWVGVAHCTYDPKEFECSKCGKKEAELTGEPLDPEPPDGDEWKDSD